jgi:hypothetical protein
MNDLGTREKRLGRCRPKIPGNSKKQPLENAPQSIFSTEPIVQYPSLPPSGRANGTIFLSIQVYVMEKKQQRLFNAKGKAAFESIEFSMIMYAIKRSLPAVYRSVRKIWLQEIFKKKVEIFGL